MRRRRSLVLSASLLAIPLGLTCQAQAAVMYSAVDLTEHTQNAYDLEQNRPGFHQMGTNAMGGGLNSHGDAAGYGYTVVRGHISYNGMPFYYSSTHDQVANQGNHEGVFDSTRNPPIPQSNPNTSWAYAINDQGWVGGYSTSNSQPYLWNDANGNGARDGDELLIISSCPPAMRATPAPDWCCSRRWAMATLTPPRPQCPSRPPRR